MAKSMKKQRLAIDEMKCSKYYLAGCKHIYCNLTKMEHVLIANAVRLCSKKLDWIVLYHSTNNRTLVKITGFVGSLQL